MTTSEPLVLTDRHDRILVITINRPQKRNAIDRATADALDVAFNELDDDPELWCGVLAGNDVAFSAGSDLTADGDYLTDRGGEYAIIRRDRRKPLVAAIEGYALGGGLEIALACDLIVASDHATFGLPEVKRGLVPSCGALFRAPRAIPLNIAMELTLTGESISADRAAHLGLVNRVVPKGRALTAAMALAREICRNGPLAVQLSRRAIDRSVATNDDVGWELTADAREQVYASKDRQEGIAAFFEKREPHWTGR